MSEYVVAGYGITALALGLYAYRVVRRGRSLIATLTARDRSQR